MNAHGFPNLLSQSEDPQSQFAESDEDGEITPHHEDDQEFKDNDLALNKGIILKQALMQQRNVFKMRDAEVAYFTANYGQYYSKLSSVSDGMRLKSRDTITAQQMLSLQMASLLSRTFKAFSQLRDSPFLRLSPTSSSIIDTKGPYLELITTLQNILRETEALCPYGSVGHLFIQVKRVDQPNSKPKWLMPFQRRSYRHGAHCLKLKKRASIALANDIMDLLEAALKIQRNAGLQTNRSPGSVDTPVILNSSWRGSLNLRQRDIESIYKEQESSGLEFALLPNFFQICRDNPKMMNSGYQVLRKVGKKCQSQFSRVSRRHYFWNAVCLPLFDGVTTSFQRDDISWNTSYQQFEVTDAAVLLFIGQHRTLSNLSKRDVLGRLNREEHPEINNDCLKQGSLQIGLKMDKITQFMKELGDILNLHRNLLIQAAATYIGTVIAQKRQSLRPRPI